jgi:tRNA pseudouridine55 synthase
MRRTTTTMRKASEPVVLSGVLVVDKPSGPTSHDVVDRVRAALGEKRAGHTGTLDPFATGVLAVCVGKGTRLVRFLAAGDKVYRATVRLGFATSTDDLLGEPLGPPRAARVEREAVDEACRRLTGDLMQVPPAYSAKRVGGRRLYDLAREGVAVERVASPVTVHALEVVDLRDGELDLEVRCSPGTYVRALARDLGEALGVGGHLTALRRTSSGPFGLESAVALDELRERGRERMVPLSDLLRDLPEARVGERGALGLRHGRDLASDMVVSGFPASPPPPRLRILDEAGAALLALAVPRGFGPPVPGLPAQPVLHPDVVLSD